MWFSGVMFLMTPVTIWNRKQKHIHHRLTNSRYLWK